MTINALADEIGKYAPLLGSIIPLPGAKLIGELIGAVFKGDFSNPSQLIDKIKADPDANAKLIDIEHQHESEIKQIAVKELKTRLNATIELAKTDVQDRISARETEINRQKFHWMLPTLSITIGIGFITCIFILLFTPMDTSDHDIVSMSLGALGTCFTQIISYYFGTSHQSIFK